MFEFLGMFMAWHFAVLAIWFILTAVCVKEDRFVLPVTLGIAAFYLNKWAFNFTLDFTLIASIKFILSYLVLGVIWSMVKWYMFLKNKLRTRRTGEGISVPDAKDYSEKIITWNLYWPFSLLGFVLGDLLEQFFTKLYKSIFNLFNGCYQGISKHVYKNL